MDISIRDLTKTYGGKVQALRGVSLEISTGLYGLLGPNGAGKTTLMRILAGILRPTSGAITIGNIDATTERGRTAVKRILGYLPQDLGVYPDLSAREFLDYIALLKGLNAKPERRQRVGDMLTLVSLSDAADRKLRTYSGGMKRRVGIAQALLNDPRLLIVDEPTAGLDPEERIRFRNLLTDLGGDRVVLLSTHIVEDIAQTCQSLAVMSAGQVVFQGSLGELVSAAQGKVWEVTTNGAKPTGDYTVIATQPTAAGFNYRVVGSTPPATDATAVVPNLEDSYVWLMREQRIAV